MSPSDYEMVEQGYDPPRMNEGELVYTGPGELTALRTQNAKLVAALLQVRAYAPVGLQSRINAALRCAAPPATGEAAMSDGAIYAAKLRSLDPEAYDRLLDEIKASAAPPPPPTQGEEEA